MVKKNDHFVTSHTLVSLPSKAGVLRAVTSAQLLQHLHPQPPLFSPLSALYGTGVFSLVARGSIRAKTNRQTNKQSRRRGVNKNVLAATRDVSAGNEGQGGKRETKRGTHAVV